jgi:ferredoxin
VIKDLVVDRGAFDRIIQAGGYITAPTGSAPDAQRHPGPQGPTPTGDRRATCIGCGACVAACPNGSAMLFTAAKVTHLGLLPQGQPERRADGAADQAGDHDRGDDHRDGLPRRHPEGLVDAQVVHAFAGVQDDHVQHAQAGDDHQHEAEQGGQRVDDDRELIGLLLDGLRPRAVRLQRRAQRRRVRLGIGPGPQVTK